MLVLSVVVVVVGDPAVVMWALLKDGSEASEGFVLKEVRRAGEAQGIEGGDKVPVLSAQVTPVGETLEGEHEVMGVSKGE